MSSSWHNILTISPTRWAIIEELSIRRRLRTFLISWGQKTCVKHCNVDLSSWYELWIAILCIDMAVIFLSFYRNPMILETVSPGGFDCLGQHRESFFNGIQRHEIILAPMCLCYCKMWKSNVKNIFISHVGLSELKVKPHGSPMSFLDCALTQLTYHVSTQRQRGKTS